MSESSLSGIPSMLGIEKVGTLVVEIGRGYARGGYAGEAGPRSIVRLLDREVDTELSKSYTKEVEEKHAKKALSAIRASLGRPPVTKLLLLQPLDRSTKSLFDVSFSLFPEAQVSFLSSEAASLLSAYHSASFQSPSSARSPAPSATARIRGTGLVVDLGWSGCRIAAFAEGSLVLPPSLHRFPSSALVAGRLSQLLQQYCPLTNPLRVNAPPILPSPELPVHVLEDILIRSCFACLRGYSPPSSASLHLPRLKSAPSFFPSSASEVEPASSASSTDPSTASAFASFVKDENRRISSVLYPLNDGTQLEIKGFVRAHASDVLFESSEEYPSLALLILQVLKELPIDLRGELASSIVFSGGLTEMHGLPYRTIEELEALVMRSEEFISLQGLCGFFDYIDYDTAHLTRAWTGGSVVGGLEEFLPSYSKDDWSEGKMKAEGDWCRIGGRAQPEDRPEN